MAALKSCGFQQSSASGSFPSSEPLARAQHVKCTLLQKRLCSSRGLAFEKVFWGCQTGPLECLQPLLVRPSSLHRCLVRSEASSSTFQERYGAKSTESRTSTSEAGERWGRGTRFSSPPDVERMHGFLPRIGLQGGHEHPGGKMKKPKQKGLSDAQRRLRRRETRIKNLIQRRKDLELLPPPPELSPEEEEHVREAAQMVVKAMVIIWQYMPALLYHIPVQVCDHCQELHVGSVGHEVRSCRGFGAEKRQASHDWRPARLKDVLPILEVYHLWQRNAPPPSHNLQSQWGRVPAIMELCFQAGAEVPGLETSAVGQADGLHPTTRLKLLGISGKELQESEGKEGNKPFPEDALEVISEVREKLGIEDERPAQPYDEMSKVETGPSLSFMFDEYRIFVRGDPDAQKEVDEQRLSDPRFLKRLHAATKLAQETGENEGAYENGEETGEFLEVTERDYAASRDEHLNGIADLAQLEDSADLVHIEDELEKIDGALLNGGASTISDGAASISDGPEVSKAEAELREQIKRAQELYLAQLAGFGFEDEEDTDGDAEMDSDGAFLDDSNSDNEFDHEKDSAVVGVSGEDTLSEGSLAASEDESEPSTSDEVTFDVTDGKTLSDRSPEERRAIKQLRRELREKHFAERVMGDLSLQAVAENVLLARQVVVDNLPDILQWYDAMRCRFCEELHVGPRGHRVRSCRGMQHPHRKGAHEWRPANQDELFPPLDVYHIDDPDALPPQHLEIYPLKEFDNDGNFLFRHEPERKWTRWPLIVEMCVQAGAKPPQEVLERTNEFERLYIEQGKVMHRDQFTQLYGMLGYEAPHGDEAWSETGPRNVKKPSYVIPGKQMPSKLGGTRHIKKEGPYFEYGIVDRWVRAGLRYDDLYGLEEDERAVEAFQHRVAMEDNEELAGSKTVSINGVELRVVKDGLRNLPRSHYIKVLTKIKQRKDQRLESGSDTIGSADPTVSSEEITVSK